MQEKSLDIEKIENAAGGSILRLHGPLLLGNFFGFQSQVRADAADLLIVDLSDVPYIDSAGIGCLVGAQVSRDHSKRKLVLVGVSDRLLGSLKVTRVHELFTYAASVEEAQSSSAAE